MTSFTNGPAMGQTLMLKRGPKYLRVVHDKATNKWDALDQIEDTPSVHEIVYAYEMVGEPGQIHLNCGRKGGSGWYVMAEYRLCDTQPENHEKRDTALWQAWCRKTFNATK